MAENANGENREGRFDDYAGGGLARDATTDDEDARKMIAIKKILVPTDFSEAADTACAYATVLAEALHARLHVLHVVEDPVVHGWAAEGYIPDLAGMREQLLANARDSLERFFPEGDRQRLGGQRDTRTGSPFVEIVRYAREHGIDLIVMGTHGRGPIAHMLMGSVAEKVMRKAPCPVLTVRQPQHKFVMP